jgi:hypothetical protein
MKIFKRILVLMTLLGCANASGPNYTLEAQVTPKTPAWEVVGTSNLPDQAQLLIALLDPEHADNYSKYVVVQEFSNVKEQAFSVKLKPLKPLKAGKYLVKITFNPSSYDWSDGKVTAIVGSKGEKLGGKYLIQEDGVNKLVNTLTVEYKGN